MDPHYAEINLNASDKVEYLFAEEKYSQSVFPTIVKFIAKSKTFHELHFDSTIVNEI